MYSILIEVLHCENPNLKSLRSPNVFKMHVLFYCVLFMVLLIDLGIYLLIFLS